MFLVKWSRQDNPGCNSYKAYYIASFSFSLASFLGVVALSVDRFLAIHLHLRYQELVTHKRVVTVVILIRAFSVFRSLLVLWVHFDFFCATQHRIKKLVSTFCIDLDCSTHLESRVGLRPRNLSLRVYDRQ